MGELIKAKFGSQARRGKNARSALCRNGHHSWQVDKSSRFDVKAGKLVTIERCQRCGTSRELLR